MNLDPYGSDLAGVKVGPEQPLLTIHRYRRHRESALIARLQNGSIYIR